MYEDNYQKTNNAKLLLLKNGNAWIKFQPNQKTTVFKRQMLVCQHQVTMEFQINY